MGNLSEIAAGMFDFQIDTRINSKVSGRRNWVIRTENDNVVFAGAWGEAKRRGWLRPIPLVYMVEKSVRFYEFTYRKDFDLALEKIRIRNERRRDEN